MEVNFCNLYQEIFKSSHVAIGITDLQGRYVQVNPAWCKLMGYTAEEALELDVESLTPPDQQERSNHNYEALVKGEIKSMHITRKYLRQGGESFWADVYVSPLKDTEDNITGILGVIVDIDRLMQAEQELGQLNKQLSEKNDELKIAVEELKHLASYDPLTHLMNRRVLSEAFHRETLRSKRKNQGLGLALCDIDNFKKLNDTYGHDVGDKALVEVSEVFLHEIRGTDYVGRWGGEEFLFILPDTGVEGIMVVIERIRKAVERIEIEKGDELVRFTASFGICYWEKDFDFATMIEEADKALYQAKRTGKNKSVLYKGE